MARCDVCGNEYDKAFRVSQEGRTMTFDSFECAIHAMAPHCAHCDCCVPGRGIEATGKIYCCAHCARAVGVRGVSESGDVSQNSRPSGSRAAAAAAPLGSSQ